MLPAAARYEWVIYEPTTNFVYLRRKSGVFVSRKDYLLSLECCTAAYGCNSIQQVKNTLKLCFKLWIWKLNIDAQMDKSEYEVKEPDTLTPWCSESPQWHQHLWRGTGRYLLEIRRALCRPLQTPLIRGTTQRRRGTSDLITSCVE